MESTEGYVQLALRVGPIVALTRFHMINAEVSYHVLLGRLWLYKHRFIPSTFHQCIKGRLNGKPVRIPANRNLFSQGEVNFAETMFYDELEPDDESPAPGTPGAPILKEEERGGRGTCDLRNLLERKRQKREFGSSGSRECVVVQKPRGRLIYRLWKCAGPKCITQKGPGPPSCMMAQEEIPEEPVKETQIQPKEELKEINLGTELESQKPVFISSQLMAQEREQLVALLQK